MQTFVTVVDCGSFVQASLKLNSSKPAVSRQISELETRLNSRLLNRTTRRLSLTDEGHQFYDHCRDILSAVDQAETKLSSRAVKPSGLLKISAPLTFGILELAPLWGKFLRENPEVQLDIELSDRTVDVVNEGFDLAIRIANLPSSMLISRKLATTQMIVCASSQYLLERGTPKSVEELSRHDVIAYSYSPVRDEWSFSSPNDSRAIKTVKVHPKIRTNNGDSARLLALDHLGLILQPSFIIGNDVKAGKLIEVLPDYRAEELGIYAVYASRQHMPAKMRSMIDFLVTAFEEPRWV